MCESRPPDPRRLPPVTGARPVASDWSPVATLTSGAEAPRVQGGADPYKLARSDPPSRRPCRAAGDRRRSPVTGRRCASRVVLPLPPHIQDRAQLQQRNSVPGTIFAESGLRAAGGGGPGGKAHRASA